MRSDELELVRNYFENVLLEHSLRMLAEKRMQCTFKVEVNDDKISITISMLTIDKKEHVFSNFFDANAFYTESLLNKMAIECLAEKIVVLVESSYYKFWIS